VFTFAFAKDDVEQFLNSIEKCTKCWEAWRLSRTWTMLSWNTIHVIPGLKQVGRANQDWTICYTVSIKGMVNIRQVGLNVGVCWVRKANHQLAWPAFDIRVPTAADAAFIATAKIRHMLRAVETKYRIECKVVVLFIKSSLLFCTFFSTNTWRCDGPS